MGGAPFIGAGKKGTSVIAYCPWDFHAWVDVAGTGDQCACPQNRFPYLFDPLCATVPPLCPLKRRFCVMARTLYSLRS
jgi:hypothetical protein